MTFTDLNNEINYSEKLVEESADATRCESTFCVNRQDCENFVAPLQDGNENCDLETIWESYFEKLNSPLIVNLFSAIVDLIIT